jgi:hypothetical protein
LVAIVVVLVALSIGGFTVCPTTHPIGPSADSVIITPKSSAGRAAALSTTVSDFESGDLELVADVPAAAEGTAAADMTAVWIDDSGLNALAVRMGPEAVTAVGARLS